MLKKRNFLCRYIDVRKKYKNLLYEISIETIEGVTNEKLEKINLIKDIKDKILNYLIDRLIIFAPVVLSLIIWFLFYETNSTIISSTLKVSSLKFKTTADAIINDLVIKGELNLQNVYNPSIISDNNEYNLITGERDSIIISNFTIPKNSTVLIESYENGFLEMYITLDSTSRNNIELATNSINSSIWITQSGSKKLIKIDSLSNLNLFSKIVGNDIFNLSLRKPCNIIFPLLKIDGLKLREYDNQDTAQLSSIYSGIIHFSETVNDSIVINNYEGIRVGAKDSLNLNLLFDNEGLLAKINGNVSKLDLMDQNFNENSKISKMPNYLSYINFRWHFAWTIILIAFPILLSLVFRRLK